MASDLILGVDGGGTQTVAAAVRPDGTVVATAVGAGVNYYNMGMDAARENLYTVVEAVLARSGETDFDTLVLGMSALDRPADADTVRRFAGDRFDPARLDMLSDAYVALMGVTLGGAGMVVICGTGSMLLLQDGEGRQHVRHGWGASLGDAGSAYTLAIEGLRAAIHAWEGMGQDTALSGAAMAYYALDVPRDLIERVHEPMPMHDRIAQFARVVLAQAEAGDAVAGGIVESNFGYIARLCALMLDEHPEAAGRVGMQGGVFLHNAWVRDLFTRRLGALCPHACVGLPAYPPEIGAVLYCLKSRGLLTPEVLRRVRQTHVPTATDV